jgi:hypothetical protein
MVGHIPLLGVPAVRREKEAWPARGRSSRRQILPPRCASDNDGLVTPQGPVVKSRDLYCVAIAGIWKGSMWDSAYMPSKLSAATNKYFITHIDLIVWCSRNN